MSSTSGLQFPLGEHEHYRSSLDFNKNVWKYSVMKVSEDESLSVQSEKEWRSEYGKYIVNNVKLCCESSEDCLEIANCGLKYIEENTEFHRGGQQYSLDEAIEKLDEQLYTGRIEGETDEIDLLSISYRDEELKGESIHRAFQKWCDSGVCEDECVKMAKFYVENEQKLDLSGKYFVLLGATAAIGPIQHLLSKGATVLAISRNKVQNWLPLFNMAKNSPGRLIFPLNQDPEGLENEKDMVVHAGCDILKETPEIAHWIDREVPKDAELIIGDYCYGDGQLFLKLSIANDAIIRFLCKKRENVKIAYIPSPSDVHIIPDECREEMRNNLKNAPKWQTAMKMFFMNSDRYMIKNEKEQIVNSENEWFSYCYGLGVEQGPNYALAKRIQHWRTIVMRQKGFCVSSNVAPPCRTRSVTHNWKFEAFYGGLEEFQPVEIFDQDSAKGILFVLFMYDIFSKDSVSNPKRELDNPLQFFSHGAFHGGVWRMGFQIESISLLAVVVYFVRQHWVFGLSCACCFVITLGLLWCLVMAFVLVAYFVGSRYGFI